jgi:hypothetical protein
MLDRLNKVEMRCSKKGWDIPLDLLQPNAKNTATFEGAPAVTKGAIAAAKLVITSSPKYTVNRVYAGFSGEVILEALNLDDGKHYLLYCHSKDNIVPVIDIHADDDGLLLT